MLLILSPHYNKERGTEILSKFKVTRKGVAKPGFVPPEVQIRFLLSKGLLYTEKHIYYYLHFDYYSIY